MPRAKTAAPLPAERARSESSSGVRGRNAVLVAFGVLSALHAYWLPLFEGPDEPDNLTYVRFLVEEGRLTQPALEPTTELEALGRGHMPPLWFLSLAPLFTAVGAGEWRPTPTLNPDFWRRVAPRDADDLRARLAAPASRLHHLHGRDEERALAGAGLDVRLLRLASLPWMLLALWATWHIARRVLGDGARATWAMALAASLPQLQNLAGTITMDPMLAAWGSLALLACVEWCGGARDHPRTATWAALAGAATGMAALTKLNGLVLAPACGLAALLAWRRGRACAKPALACAVAFLAVAGPYYAWGFAETGHPLWSWRYQQVSPFHNPPGQAPAAWDADGVAVFAAELFQSWLAKLGWTSVWFPQWISAPVFTLWASGAAIALACACAWRAASAGAARTRTVASSAGFLGNSPPSQSRSSSGARVFACAFPALALAAFGLWLVWRWGGLGPRMLAASYAEARAGVAASTAVLSLALFLALRGRGRALRGDGVEPERRTALAFLLASAALILGAEVWFNLRFPQPQARHMIPFLAALVVPVACALDRVRLLRSAVVLQAVLSIAALPWLVGRLRPEGWNTSALYAATDLERPLDPSLAGERASEAEVEWLGSDAERAFGPTEPPTLAWQIDLESEYDLALAWNPALHHRPWRADGALVRAIADQGFAPRGSFELPADFWSALPADTRLWAQVVRLGADGNATGHSSVRELVRGK